MSALLFIIAIDWVTKSTLSSDNTGRRWTLFTSLEDLDYADDLALLSHLEKHMQSKTSKLQNNAEKIGLKINTKKTEVMSLVPNTQQEYNCMEVTKPTQHHLHILEAQLHQMGVQKRV